MGSSRFLQSNPYTTSHIILVPHSHRNMRTLGSVTNGKFCFAVDSFYVESSGHNLHRRATLEDLKRLFDTASASTGSSSKSDHVGHWYEAQLLHYGLAPSKNKAVAKMRLLDALKAGSLAVPKEILKIEADLKKEWKKRDKEARAESSAARKTVNGAAPKGKRKRDESEKAAGEGASQSTAKGAKKAKPAASTNRATAATAKSSAKSNDGPKTKNQNTSAPQKKSTKSTEAGSNTGPKSRANKRGGATAGARAQTDTDQATTSQPRRLKQTARCSRGAASVGGRRPAPVREPEQTATQTNPPSYDSLYQTVSKSTQR